VDDPLLLPAESAELAKHPQLLRGKNGEFYAQFAIGHQALMVPCLALARVCDGACSRIAERQANEHPGDVVWGRRFWERFCCSLLPIPFAAGAALFVWRIARALGATQRESWLVMLVAVLATQMGPGATETMSDVPGLCLLLGAVDA